MTIKNSQDDLRGDERREVTPDRDDSRPGFPEETTTDKTVIIQTGRTQAEIGKTIKEGSSGEEPPVPANCVAHTVTGGNSKEDPTLSTDSAEADRGKNNNAKPPDAEYASEKNPGAEPELSNDSAESASEENPNAEPDAGEAKTSAPTDPKKPQALTAVEKWKRIDDLYQGENRIKLTQGIPANLKELHIQVLKKSEETKSKLLELLVLQYWGIHEEEVMQELSINREQMNAIIKEANNLLLELESGVMILNQNGFLILGTLNKEIQIPTPFGKKIERKIGIKLQEILQVFYCDAQRKRDVTISDKIAKEFRECTPPHRINIKTFAEKNPCTREDIIRAVQQLRQKIGAVEKRIKLRISGEEIIASAEYIPDIPDDLTPEDKVFEVILNRLEQGPERFLLILMMTDPQKSIFMREAIDALYIDEIETNPTQEPETSNTKNIANKFVRMINTMNTDELEPLGLRIVIKDRIVYKRATPEEEPTPHPEPALYIEHNEWIQVGPKP